jgi:hypothetical protein
MRTKQDIINDIKQAKIDQFRIMWSSSKPGLYDKYQRKIEKLFEELRRCEDKMFQEFFNKSE